MLKIKLRKNLLYLLVYYISYHIRKIIVMIIGGIFNFNPTYVFLYLMSLGEIFGGLTILVYQNRSKKQKKEIKYFGLELIYTKAESYIVERPFKILLLIFFASFFDFMEFVLGNIYVPLYDPNFSPTIDLRLGCITTIGSALICIKALRFKIGKHHKVSLIFMIVFVVLALIVEISFKPDNITFGRFFAARFLVCYYLIGVSFVDCIEKYLVDVNFISPFKIIMMEGIFQIIMDIFISIEKDPFKDIIKLNEENNVGKIIVFILLLFLYFFLSAMVNAYKIYCNVIYSPMARELIDYLMGPLINIYYFIQIGDFQKNYLYYFVSEIINIVIVFFSCVYNEYIILFCFGLEHNTKDEIINRALQKDNQPIMHALTEDFYDDDEDEKTI